MSLSNKSLHTSIALYPLIKKMKTLSLYLTQVIPLFLHVTIRRIDLIKNVRTGAFSKTENSPPPTRGSILGLIFDICKANEMPNSQFINSSMLLVLTNIDFMVCF